MSTGPRFRFGLERVREIRAHDEDRAKEAFAASLQERLRGAALLAAASEQVDAAHAARREGDAAEASGPQLVSMQAYLDRVEQSRRDAERELQQSEHALAERRRALTEASRRRQALDRLKERRAAEHAAEAARREGNFLDEIATGAHVRRSSSARTGGNPTGEAA
ncbi:MAG TPA: flagellar export protein FliJ [Solirubrobacteraceae bacterium]